MPKGHRKVKRVSEAAVAPPVMSASAFKARCLELMDLVAEGRGEIVITKRGEPVVKVVAAGARRGDLLRGVKGTVPLSRGLGGPAGGGGGEGGGAWGGGGAGALRHAPVGVGG